MPLVSLLSLVDVFRASYTLFPLIFRVFFIKEEKKELHCFVSKVVIVKRM